MLVDILLVTAADFVVKGLPLRLNVVCTVNVKKYSGWVMIISIVVESSYQDTCTLSTYYYNCSLAIKYQCSIEGINS